MRRVVAPPALWPTLRSKHTSSRHRLAVLLRSPHSPQFLPPRPSIVRCGCLRRRTARWPSHCATTCRRAAPPRTCSRTRTPRPRDGVARTLRALRRRGTLKVGAVDDYEPGVWLYPGAGHGRARQPGADRVSAGRQRRSTGPRSMHSRSTAAGVALDAGTPPAARVLVVRVNGALSFERQIDKASALAAQKPVCRRPPRRRRRAAAIGPRDSSRSASTMTKSRGSQARRRGLCDLGRHPAGQSRRR